MTSGRSAGPGASCQMRASDAPVSLGKARAACSSSVHVAPRSSERRSTGPQWLLTDPVHRRVLPERESMQVASTTSQAIVGPDTSQLSDQAGARSVNSLLVVPTSTTVLVVSEVA